MVTKLKEYTVYVSWVTGAQVVVKAENEEEAVEFAYGMSPDQFDNQEYIRDSFYADIDLVEEIISSSE
jgi:hypothetical protein